MMPWGLNSWKAALQKRTWGSWQTPSWTWGSSVSLPQRRLVSSWAAAGKVSAAGRGMWACPSAQHWWGHSRSVGSSSGLPRTRETWTCWRESVKGPQRWWRVCSTSRVRKCWESRDCSAQRRRGSGGSPPCPLSPEGRAQGGQPGSSQWCLAPGQEAVSTNWSSGGSPWTSGNTFSWCGWWSSGSGHLEKLWALPLCRSSETPGMRAWLPCSGWPCRGRGGAGVPGVPAHLLWDSVIQS